MRLVFLALLLTLSIALYFFWRSNTRTPPAGRFNPPPIHMPKDGILM